MLELLRAITKRATGKAEVERPATAAKPWLTPAVIHGNDRPDLAYVYGEGELKEWFQSVTDAVGRDDVGFVCEPKCEGVRVSLTYEEGVFVEGRTLDNSPRAITEQLHAVRGIPSRLFRRDVRGKIQVLGEVYVSRSTVALATHTGDWGLDVTDNAPTDIFVYGIGYPEGGSAPNNQWAALAYLKNLGFRTNPDSGLARSPDDVVRYYEALLDRRDGLDYDCGGVVVKVDSLDYRQMLGYEVHGPRWAAAYMFTRPHSVPRLGASYASREDAAPMSSEYSYGQERPLSGIQFVVKASTKDFPRARTESMIEELGGIVSGSVSTTTDYVVIAESSGASLASAGRTGIKLVSQAEFLRYYRAVRLSGKVQRLIDRLDRL